ncbi:MAG: phytoene desaturase, partial [Flavobacterium sp.]
VFDMGPSWYWMPEVFENFFNDFGYTASDFYKLILLDPSFAVIFKDEGLAIPSSYEKLRVLFENIEEGSALKLDAFMKEAAFKYNVGMKKLVYKPGLSLTEFLDIDLIKGVLKLQVFTSFSKHVKRYFKDPKLIALMEFPVLFLGATPEETPALYSLMNYAGLKLGTWYPKGGFGEVVNAMKKVGENLGVKFHTDEAVMSLKFNDNLVQNVVTSKQEKAFDAVIASADYHYVEQVLLPEKFRNYSKEYWKNRVLAPSCLIFYLGTNKRITKLDHHNLFFDEDLKKHAFEIYKDPKWPDKPLFYVCCPSKSDPAVAPKDHENLFILMPIATGLSDTEELRGKYFEIIMKRLEKYCDQEIMAAITYKKSYCVNDFILDYNALRGNAYGLANTLKQTANLKPSIKNKTLGNLFYAGQLTVPGPGVPPSIISGKVAATQVINYLNQHAQQLLKSTNPKTLQPY